MKLSSTSTRSDWETVLSEFVDEKGQVGHIGLSDRRIFDGYVARIEAIGPRTSPGLFPTRNSKLVYTINSYNALTFTGVLKRGAEKSSIFDRFQESFVVYERSHSNDSRRA